MTNCCEVPSSAATSADLTTKTRLLLRLQLGWGLEGAGPRATPSTPEELAAEPTKEGGDRAF